MASTQRTLLPIAEPTGLFLNQLLQRFSAIFKTASFGPAIVYGFAGIAFILATLAMSLALDANAFAEATLLLSISNLAAAAAPAGINGVVLRNNLRTDRRFISIALLIVLCFTLLAGAVAHSLYSLRAGATTILCVSILCGGIAFLALPKLQRAHRFMSSAFVAQSAAFSVLFAAVLMLAGWGRTPWFPIAMAATGFLLSSLLFLKPLFAQAADDIPMNQGLWRQALHFWGIAFSFEIMAQLERLIIPIFIDHRAVGSFAVVAAVAIAPYRIIELATASTLVTHLRAAASVRQRVSVFTREAMLLIPVSIGGGAILLFAGLPICRYVRPDADDITYAALATAAFSGICRVIASLTRSIASAFCSESELARINMGSWASIAFGILCAWGLSGAGLTGVIFGVALGWLFRATVIASVSYKYMRH